MPLDPDLLKLLCCPRCRGDLRLTGPQGPFVCRACQLAFPIVDDVPNFLLDDAQPLTSPPAGE